MKINISGSIELGESFPAYIEEKFEKETEKYFVELPVVEVHVNKQKDIIQTNITLNNSKIVADAEDSDVYKSFDLAFEKLFTQIKKEKDKFLSKKKKGE